MGVSSRMVWQGRQLFCANPGRVDRLFVQRSSDRHLAFLMFQKMGFAICKIISIFWPSRGTYFVCRQKRTASCAISRAPVIRLDR